MNIHVKAPLDYAPIPDDHDEPYNRCPLCNAVIAAFATAAVLGGLFAAAFAIRKAVEVLL